MVKDVKGRNIYVTTNPKANGNGKNWKNATSIQNAFASAQPGDKILLKQGTYKPTNTNDRDSSFVMKEGVSIFGGYKGEGQKRNVEKYQTVLSGDIGKAGDLTDNSKHVVIGAKNSQINGVTIRDGYAMGDQKGGVAPLSITPEIIVNGNGDGAGAGLLNFKADTLVKNVKFINNHAIKGGAVYNMSQESTTPDVNKKGPRFVNTEFKNNTAEKRGGAMENDFVTNPIVINSKFTGNKSAKGGALYNDFASTTTIVNSKFNNNEADSAGAIGNDGGSGIIAKNITVTKNRSRDDGAGIYSGSGQDNKSFITNSKIQGNKSKYSDDSGIYTWHGNTTQVVNSDVDNKKSSAKNKGYKADSKEFQGEKLNKSIKELQKHKTKASELPSFGAPEGQQPANNNPNGPTNGLPPNGHQPPTEGPNGLPPNGLPPEGALPPNGLPPNGSVPQAETTSSDQTAKTDNTPKRIIYVNGKAKGKNSDGKDWDSAYKSLSRALKDASTDGAKVIVTGGKYTPAGKGRNATFKIPENVTIEGGYTGNGSERNLKTNKTVLSGEIGQKGKKDNAYHVVTASNGSAIDGVVIQDGNANGKGYNAKGGAIAGYQDKPQDIPVKKEVTGYSFDISNSTIRNNNAKEGGALYSYDRGNVVIKDSTFANNTADNGGAIVQRVGSHTDINNVKFANNRAKYNGGAIYSDYGAKADIANSSFKQNKAGSNGGGVYSVSRASQLGNTTTNIKSSEFINNSAEKGYGGAVNFNDESTGTLSNNTVKGNKAKKHPKSKNFSATLGSTITPE